MQERKTRPPFFAIHDPSSLRRGMQTGKKSPIFPAQKTPAYEKSKDKHEVRKTGQVVNRTNDWAGPL